MPPQVADWEKLQSLFTGYRSGKQACIQPLFTTLSKILKSYYRARIASDTDAEDLAQAALLKIHFSRESFDQARSLKTWVFTVAGRTLIDHWRGSSHNPLQMASIDAIEGEDDRESELALIPSTELDPAIKTELKHDLEQAMQILKPIDRSIVYLYVVEEFTMEEIGESLGISESAAKVRAHRSYKKLRDALDQKKKGNAR